MSSEAPTRGDDAGPRQEAAPPSAPSRLRRRLWLVEVYRTALGKKYAMALSGVVLMAYVFLHMVGNLKLYFGETEMNDYAVWLREIGYPLLPEEGLLWGVRLLLLLAVVVHIHAAFSLVITNRRARPEGYQAPRDYVAVDFASRTMLWTGIIIVAFVIFHLNNLTFGTVNPDFVYGEVYANTVASFQRLPVAGFYVVANAALGYHLYHGAWSLFQSMGWNHPRFNHWRRYFAVAFALVVVVPNISFPLAVQLGIIS